jgi:putative aminopeptidase FrvX
MKVFTRVAVVVMGIDLVCSAGHAQHGPDPTDWQRVFRVPAVSGYEKPLGVEISKRLKDLSPKTDSLGNIYINVGSGAPHRLIVTPIDEPGYVISEITEQGYLRVQRLPQQAPNEVFDLLNFAQPVTIETRAGQQVTGVFAGLSVHLQTGRPNPPQMTHLEDLYVDIGASSADDVRKTGVGLLDPLVVTRQWLSIGKSGEAGPATGDRIGAYALVQVLEKVKESKAKGTTTLAFLTQQWLGGRGLERILEETRPDELIYVGRLAFQTRAMTKSISSEARPGDGILIGSSAVHPSTEQSLATELHIIAEKEKIPIHMVPTNEPLIRGYGKNASIPKRWVELGVPTLWPVTPGEFVASKDIAQLERLLSTYLEIPKSTVESEKVPEVHREYRRSEALIGTYGVSGHEEEVRQLVISKLDLRLRNLVHTDAAGNLVLHVGNGKRDEKTPRVVFIAHMDETGYEVKKIEDDGRLRVEALGGGYPQYFLGHVVLVHKKEDRPVGGVLELPSGWDQPGLGWLSGPQSMNQQLHVYVGTTSKEDTEKLGIAVGDSVTIPKSYRRMLGTRATARSFDDRVGCSALITAANAIGTELPGRDVTFVWSTQEEVGLVGAGAFADQAAKEGRVPDVVFAVDTFVSSDSPLESKRYANAELGKGFVVRALDNSNIVPTQYLDRVVSLANDNNIPVQYGVTGGGNDGAVFPQYGSVDVALGWPLRYSHSPAEVIDTRDFDALSKIVELLARNW